MRSHMWNFPLLFFAFAASTVAVLTPLAAHSAASSACLSQYTFSMFLVDFDKRYNDPVEHHKRNAIFNENLAGICAFNKDPNRSYRLGVNQFADLTEEEVAARFTGRVALRTPAGSPWRASYKYTKASAPEAMSWQQARDPVLTPVKDQGKCGSCWAHAATESIESMYAIHTGNLLTLSTQQITSCADNPEKCGGTGGCGGGTVQLAWDYVKSAGGITLNADYPYVSGKTSSTQQCVLNASMPCDVHVYGYVSLPPNDYDAVLEALVEKGPLAVSVDASQWGLYAGGVFDGCGVGNANITINHAVQLVGFGKDNRTQQQYWIVRNSWGEKWGEKGYIRLLRQKGNHTCTFNQDWSTAGGGCANDPNTTVVACGMCGILYDVAYPDVMEPPGRGRLVWVAGAAFGGLGVLMIILVVCSKCGGGPKRGYGGLSAGSEHLH
ncbi:cysteine protease [Trypanosoma conorhini]|uniref:Cysteine protease n=1 Tax=Trypanosoma conorhini TaxID=83891 RepID=A0A3R7NVT4_9TRYP|nr:cysteine protease [Trypanosoma conorhini]RNF12587.1 cysteine protease [Trypanosoma conorhini]